MNLEQRVSQLEATVLELRATIEKMLANGSENEGTPKGDQLLTVKEACEEFKIPQHLIYEARSNGLLIYERRGKSYLFKRKVIKLWIAQMQGPKELRLNIDEHVANYMQTHPMRG